MQYLIFFFLGTSGAFIVAKWANSLGLIDQPNHRSSHSRPTAKGGGIGIVAAFILASLVVGLDWTFWLPIFAVSLIGLYGDKIHIKPIVRLFFQFGATLVIIWGSETVTVARLLPFWAVFIVGTTNCYNFMDGINGIASITGIVAFSLVGFYADAFNLSPVIPTVAFATALACAGFLPFNMHRASVFMGDIGSILLGFAFGGMVFLCSHSIIDFLCLSAFMFPFYSDEIITKAIQLKEKSPFMEPHRNHLYQLMANEMRIDHWKISVGYGVLQLVVGISVILLRPFGILAVLPLLVGYFGLFVALSCIVRKKVREKLLNLRYQLAETGQR